jgi:hypothetical protein
MQSLSPEDCGHRFFVALRLVAKCRDGARSVAAATNACDVTGNKTFGLLNTFAAAYAEPGDSDSTVMWQAEAIELASDAKAKNEYDTLLKPYQPKKPYRATQP